MPAKKNDPNRKIVIPGTEYMMDRKGNLYSPNNDGDDISVSANDIDQIGAIAEMMQQMSDLEQKLCKAKCPDHTAGGHEVNINTGFNDYDCELAIGCNAVPLHVAIRITKLSRKLRGLK